jgi:hypothetical protein
MIRLKDALGTLEDMGLCRWDGEDKGGEVVEEEGPAMSSYEGNSPPLFVVPLLPLKPAASPDPCSLGRGDTGTHFFKAYAPPQTSHRPPPLGWKRLKSQIKGKIHNMMDRNLSHLRERTRERVFDGRIERREAIGVKVISMSPR